MDHHVEVVRQRHLAEVALDDRDTLGRDAAQLLLADAGAQLAEDGLAQQAVEAALGRLAGPRPDQHGDAHVRIGGQELFERRLPEEPGGAGQE